MRAVLATLAGLFSSAPLAHAQSLAADFARLGRTLEQSAGKVQAAQERVDRGMAMAQHDIAPETVMELDRAAAARRGRWVQLRTLGAHMGW
jgi:outer membrane murein-binding lipoprotein Lpp